jgi:hypothetical protein
MLIFLAPLLVSLRSLIRSRLDLQLENLALRHQINVLRRSAKKRAFSAYFGGRRADFLCSPDCVAGRGIRTPRYGLETYKSRRLRKLH